MAFQLLTDKDVSEFVKKYSPHLILNEGENMENNRWYKADIGNVCSDGSSDHIYLRKTDSPNLAFIFMGGGACWDTDTMKYPMGVSYQAKGLPGLYMPNSNEYCDLLVFLSGVEPGLLSEKKDNPFHDWNIALLTYTTADFNLGRNDIEYTDLEGNSRMFHFHGYHHFEESLRKASEMLSCSGHLLIAGISAGAFTVPAVSDRIAEAFKEAEDVTALVDSALTVNPEWPSIVKELWNVPDNLADAAHSASLCADWMEYAFSRDKGKIKYLYTGSTHDVAFAAFERKMRMNEFLTTKEGCDTCFLEMQDLVKRLKANIPGICFFIYDYPDGAGTKHCITLSPHFLREDHDIRPCDWLMDAVKGNIYNVGLSSLNL